MRKFRLKANATRWFDSFMKGVVYNEDSRGDYNNGRTVLEYVQEFPNDWQEVFEDEPTKPLHKETDLGYYAGLAMHGLFANPKIETNNDSNATFEDFSKYCIESAKELIKQLNEETK